MTDTYRLSLAHLYPAEMSVYGDRGNVIALRQRCLWRGIDLEVTPVEPGDVVDWAAFDLAFFGGGQDSGQSLIASDLLERQGPGLRAAIDDGLVLLAICGGYQLLGHYFITHTGERLPGLGALDVHTVGGSKRLIGNIVVELGVGGWGLEAGTKDPAPNPQPPTPIRLVGFENHSGRTYHGPGVRSLGRVLAGHGDNGEDGHGGAAYRNTIGCYLHGSLLPKNPQLTDQMIDMAMRRRYGADVTIAPLDASLELRAQQTMTSRIMRA
ncbi:glutamine amidotransferase [Chloroflexales bacterium ZM16-3]|nr:glutamine amidotransferase [Chloroflexales bacterium ZM16-3]